jgi:dynein heavy chain, axonemal
VPQREKREVWLRFVNAFFGFAFIWAFGGHYKPSAIRFIDNMMRDFFSKLQIPLNDTVYEYRLDEKACKFVHWKELVPKFEYPEQPTPFFQLVVPTIDTLRSTDIVKKLVSVSKPIFLTGNTGTGKSMIIQQFIAENRESMELTPIILNFSAQTTSGSTQTNIDSKLQKKKSKVYGAKGNSKTLIFIDDVNMPMQEQYGAQPPIELMRQLIDHGGMYDRPNFFWKRIERFSVVCAAAPPSGGRTELTSRFMRHFMVLNVPDP